MLSGTPSGNSNISEGKLLGDDAFLRRVAQLSYEDGLSQEAIAKQEFCSRQTISKALQKAREKGIVRITIVPEQRAGYLRNLSRELRTKLGLEDLVIVAGRKLNETAEHEVAEDILDDIVREAADYLDQMLTNDDILAVSGGKDIMRNIVRYLKPGKLLPNLQVVPTIGFVASHTSLGDSNLIAFDIATAYGARHSWLPIPAIVESYEQREQARALPIVRDVLKTVDKATIVILGIWPPHIREEVMAEGVLTREQIEALEEFEPAVNINHWAFDSFGICINNQGEHPPYYLTGFEIPKLRDRIKEGKVKVILVAGASRSYVPAIRAALEAGIANILVTDHVTAQELLDQKNKE